MIFPCTKCGACCRRAHLIQPFRYGDRIHGGCIMLNENTCDIYKDRPLICNIQKMKDLLFPDLTEKEHYKNNAIICNKWIKKDGMDNKYLIDMKQFED